MTRANRRVKVFDWNYICRTLVAETQSFYVKAEAKEVHPIQLSIILLTFRHKLTQIGSGHN